MSGDEVETDGPDFKVEFKISEICNTSKPKLIEKIYFELSSKLFPLDDVSFIFKHLGENLVVINHQNKPLAVIDFDSRQITSTTSESWLRSNLESNITRNHYSAFEKINKVYHWSDFGYLLELIVEKKRLLRLCEPY